MKRKRFVIILALLVLLISVIIISNNKDKSKNKEPIINKEEYEQEVIDINNKMVTDLDMNDIKKMTNKKLNSRYIMVGKESYLREKIVNGNSFDEIDKYYEAQNKYANNVEKIIKENFEFEITESIETIDGFVDVKFTYKPYYYHWYLNDMGKLQDKLLEMSGYKESDFMSEKPSKKMVQDVFKAKIKALEIMNDYLENYRNDYEFFDDNIMYDSNNTKFSQPYIESYLLLADGSASTKFNFASAEFETEQNQRLNKYLAEASANGTLDKKNPLKLK